MKKQALMHVIDSIEQAYRVRLVLMTPTPDGSSLSDFPALKGAMERLSKLLGFHVDGSESLLFLVSKCSARR
jgi:hypothetical protein